MIYELIFQDIFRDFYSPHHPADHKDKVHNNHKLKSRPCLKRLLALDHNSRALRAESFGVGQELMAEIVSFANNDYTRRRDSYGSHGVAYPYSGMASDLSQVLVRLMRLTYMARVFTPSQRK
jgi:hypothetical protein